MLTSIDEIVRSFVPSPTRWDANPNWGRHCHCHIVDDYCVLKTFPQGKSRAESAWMGQWLLSRRGFAPKCWGFGQYVGEWGFFSERAIPCQPEVDDWRAIEELSNKLAEWQFRNADLAHSPNTGHLHGKLMCLDTGDVSMFDVRNNEWVWL